MQLKSVKTNIYRKSYGQYSSNGQMRRKYKIKANIYIEPNLLLLKENELKIINKAYEKCFYYTIKL